MRNVYSAHQCKDPGLGLEQDCLLFSLQKKNSPQLRDPEITGQGKLTEIIVLSLLTIFFVNFYLGNAKYIF